MRLTITILSGVRAGQRVLLGPGESLRVGRTTNANIAIADDPTMSGVHYEVQASDDGATIRDLGSRNGLFVNGEQVSEAALHGGDQVRAGRTFFSISIEGVEAPVEPGAAVLPGDETKAPGPADATRAALPPLISRLEIELPPAAGTMFFAGELPALVSVPADDATLDGSADRQPFQQQTDLQGRLYAVVDGAVAQSLVQEAKRGKARVESLLASGSSPYLTAVAPYLIEVGLDSGFLGTWRTMLGKSPGILIESQADFDQVLIQARSIFARKDERGKQSFFRFYDPKLLYGWLSSCTAPQLASFFGCFDAVIVGVESGNRLLRLTRSGDQLNTEEVLAP